MYQHTQGSILAVVMQVAQDGHNMVWMSMITQKFVQGVPKVRSSNFMHYKLYFYMKFLQDVYFSIEYTYSEFQ